MILVIVIEVMYTVGIVPENTEVLCGRFQRRKATDRFIGIRGTKGIGIFRNTPDALYRVVFGNQFFYQIHIGTFRRHRNGNQFVAEVFGDGKVPVVPGCRAEKLYMIQLAPGSISHDTVRMGPCDRVVHHVQRGVAVNNNIVGIVFRHGTDQLLGLRYAVQDSVITAVGTVLTAQISA